MNLDEIRNQVKRHAEAVGPGGEKAWLDGQLARRAPELIAEIERLRNELDSVGNILSIVEKERDALAAMLRAASGSPLRAQASEPERCEHCGGELVLFAPKDTVKICCDCGVAAIRRRADRPVDLWLGPPRRDTVRLADMMNDPTCGMAADPQRSCGTTWLRDPSPILTMPDPAPRVARMHRCGLVGEHGAHQCPCGSWLVTTDPRQGG